LSGYESPTDYLETEAEMIAPSEDISDIATEYGEELPTPITADQDSAEPLYAEEILSPEEEDYAVELGAQAPDLEEMQAYEETPTMQEQIQPKGGLTAMTAPVETDVLEQASESMLKPQTEDTVVDVAGEKPGIGMKAPTLGGLAAGFMPTGGGKSLISGALNQILKPAIRQGITKTLRGTPTRPVAKRPAPTRVAAKPPARMSPTQLAALRPTQPVAPRPVQQGKPMPPKKKDVSTLTPVTNIAGLTSLLKSKG
jgi:hypothetical protein